MTGPLRVLLPSDVFPPRCGGAGWSAHALALALIGRGHDVTAIVPRRRTKDQEPRTKGERSLGRGAAALEREEVAERQPASIKSQAPSPTLNIGLSSLAPGLEDVLGVPTVRVDYWAPNVPIVQNYFRHERLWPRLAGVIADIAGSPAQSAISNLQSPIIHAQHVQSAPAAVLAGRRLGAPVVITVRDHWPWDYFSTGLHGDRLPYGRQTWASLAADLPARLGPARGAAALLAIPYMLAHLRRRQEALRQAQAVIAVSRYMARRLEPIVGAERVYVLPNIVDLAAIDAAIATPAASVAPGKPYLLFVGKLERNKGAHLLIDVFRELATLGAWGLGLGAWEPGAAQASHASPQVPQLIIAGDGPLRPELERELAALGLQVRFLEWVDHDEVLRLMAGCELLLFPSAWGEPLSRVPLEASACRAAILAMPTGGTPDIIDDGVNGALETTPGGFARRLAQLLADPARRRELGAAARRVARERFAKEVVAQRIEALYRSLLYSSGQSAEASRQ